MTLEDKMQHLTHRLGYGGWRIADVGGGIKIGVIVLTDYEAIQLIRKMERLEAQVADA